MVPISFEPYGRLASESFKPLEEIAVNSASASTHKWAGSRLLNRIIERCLRAVIWATADVALASLGQGATSRESAIARSSAANGHLDLAPHLELDHD